MSDIFNKLMSFEKEIDGGLSAEELVKVRNKIYRIKTFGTEETLKRLSLLQCIKEFLNDSDKGGIESGK